MKWNGTVSHDCHTPIAARFATANAAHASSRPLGLRKAISSVADGVDRRVRPQLLPQPADADLDDVRARVEVVAPDLREETLPADDLARVEREVVQEAELPIGEVGRPVVETRAAARAAQRQPRH